jgi:hypothetical protein
MNNYQRDAWLLRHSIAIESEFVPFSKSRNKDNKDDKGRTRLSLNWKVTLLVNARVVLTTDYGAGAGHCPSYGTKAPASYPGSALGWQQEAARHECETGQKAVCYGVVLGFKRTSGAIEPNTHNVLHSLCLDAGAIDYATFEEWASDMGYDPDSRSGEKAYRACLEIGLKMRNGLGDAQFRALREIYQDY